MFNVLCPSVSKFARARIPTMIGVALQILSILEGSQIERALIVFILVTLSKSRNAISRRSFSRT